MVKYPNRNWKTIWENLKLQHIPLQWKIMFCTIHEIIPTGEKIPTQYSMTNIPLCQKCNMIDTLKHRLSTCSNIHEIWSWTIEQLRLAPSGNPNDHQRTALLL